MASKSSTMPLQELFKKMSSKTKPGANESFDSPNPGGKKNKIEDIYQKKTQLEHILLRPDTYIGSVEPVVENMWIIKEGKIVQKEVRYVPGLFKIFDEILVNAADNKQRDKNMNTIKIDIDQENNLISIWNNGQGIPVVEHKTEKMMVPTMIFGHLLTSSNFNDEEKKVTGGRNGYGAKLCNVFSTKFVVETATRKYKKAFKQTWENNMSKTSDPKIKDGYSGEDYTKVSFKPDLSKFKMDRLEDDIVSIFHRRAYDIAATSQGVKVLLNGTKLPVKAFKDYVDLFLKEREDDSGKQIKFNYERVNERWEIAVAPSENGFQQISFVNSIATTKGGRHVDYVTDMMIKNLAETLKKKNKNGIDIKPFQVKNHLWIFVNCLIENPTFDSQTKEHMTLQAKSFGSKCVPSEKFYAAIVKSGIVETVLQWAKFKAENMLNKNSGKKSNKIKGIPKLEDANNAGTKNHSLNCTLILTEGDSAKTLAVAGLGVVGRDDYGVFPLRGKLLNVREASYKQIKENVEINALIKILGLQYNRKYNGTEDMRTLRYGKLMIMTDQDHDGSHIKGLIINFIHHNWPSLLKMNFIEEFITPIVKVTKGKEIVSFYSIPEMEEWKKRQANWKSYNIKYYKGLGTSTSKEAKEYFTDMRRHRIKFEYQGKTDDDQITMAFSKKCIEQRKDWLTNWMEGCKRRKIMGMAEDVIYDKDVTAITYSEFINKELVLFSNLDNERSIPSMVDGLKPGQRKVLYTCFKRNDKKEVKVAQLAGSVAEHSAYHHGEQSLMSTIVNLAQDYVGSNNINLLQPIGQFGTRLTGGKDSASPRYIFTKLSPLARVIFDIKDDAVLKNLYDDNQKIEPEWYCPIIPMVLVNGADGIGTGWMTKIPNFNPREIVENLRRLIKGEEAQPMKPWYKNFRGEIIEISSHKYACNGEVSILSSSKIEITELPIGTWTQHYKESVMETMQNAPEKQEAMISDYKEYNTDTTVKFVVSMREETLNNYEEQGLHKVFKLQTALNLSSMVLFDRNGVLKKYTSVQDILQEFFELRTEFYSKRRDYLLGILSAETSKLSNQARFIIEKCNGTLTVENKKKKLMVEELISRKYDSDPVKIWKAEQDRLLQREQGEESSDENEENSEVAEEGKDFDYLLGMPIMSLTLERKESLIKQRDDRIKVLELLKKKTPTDLYNDDLDEFMVQLDRVEKAEEDDETAGAKSKKIDKDSKKKKPALKGVNRKAVMESAPSPMGRKVKPAIDDMIKKAEMAAKVKEKKGKRGPKKRENPEDDEKDEFDMLADQADKSLVEKLNSSSENDGTKAAAKGKKAEGGRGKKKPTDGMKQTKLAFKAKAKSPEKKKKRRGDDSSDDDILFDDSDMDLPVRESMSPSRPRTQRAAAVAKKTYKLDESSDEEPFKSDESDENSDEEAVTTSKPKTNGNVPPIRIDSDSEPEVVTKSNGNKRTADESFSDAESIDDSPKKVSKTDSGSLFDSLLESKKGAGKRANTPPPQSRKVDSDSESDVNEIFNSPEQEKPKKVVKKAPAKPRAVKPKKTHSKKSRHSDDSDNSPVKKKKSRKGKQSDSDDEFDPGSPGNKIGAAGDRPGRNRNLAKYVFDADSDSDFD